jgi:hypothetical protein
VEHRSLLNRSGICDGINRCNICFVHAAVLSIKTAFNLVLTNILKYQRGNQKPLIEEGHTIQQSKEKEQKDQQ